jgi:hypothetical protein
VSDIIYRIVPLEVPLSPEAELAELKATALGAIKEAMAASVVQELNRDKPRQTASQEATMVTRASGSQSTKTVPRQGQNKPQSGGAAGAGKDRGTAKLPTISRTTTRK